MVMASLISASGRERIAGRRMRAGPRLRQAAALQGSLAGRASAGLAGMTSSADGVRPSRCRQSGILRRQPAEAGQLQREVERVDAEGHAEQVPLEALLRRRPHPEPDRQSGVAGKSVYVRVALGGRRIIKKTKTQKITQN